MTYHIHAVVAPWCEKTTQRRGKQRLLQPSSHPLLKDYEKAQDDVGEHFGRLGLGLVRGRRSKEAQRVALAERRAQHKESKEPDSFSVPRLRRHTPTPVWWAQETERLRREKAAFAQKREAAARQAEAVRRAEERVHAAQEAAAARESRVQQREEAASARLREADEVIAVAEHFIAGRGKMPDRTAGPRVGTFLAALSNLRASVTARADAEAARRLQAERAALAAAARSVADLKQRIMRALPEALWRRFESATAPASERAERALRSAQTTQSREVSR